MTTITSKTLIFWTHRWTVVTIFITLDCSGGTVNTDEFVKKKYTSDAKLVCRLKLFPTVFFEHSTTGALLENVFSYVLDEKK